MIEKIGIGRCKLGYFFLLQIDLSFYRISDLTHIESHFIVIKTINLITLLFLKPESLINTLQRLKYLLVTLKQINPNFSRKFFIIFLSNRKTIEHPLIELIFVDIICNNLLGVMKIFIQLLCSESDIIWSFWITFLKINLIFIKFCQ